MLRRVLARQTPERDLALCQFAIALLGLWAAACISMVLTHPAVYENVSIFSMQVRQQPWLLRLAIDAGVAVVMMLPATLFMGLSFPLASRLYLGDVKMLGARVGSAYLLANLGSILGAVLAGVVLLPGLGTIGGTKLSAAINLTLGIAVMAGIRPRARRSVSRAVVAIVAVGVVCVMLPTTLGLRGEAETGRLVYAEEADQGTVHVVEESSDPTKREMLINGCKIGCGAGYRRGWMYRKQVLLAHLPMALDPSIRHTLNIGLGSASTLHALAAYPTVQRLDCVEINDAVVRASALFEESSVLEDERVRLVVDDAVHYLLRCRERYDAIISDGKQDPFFAGNATLLCRP